MNFSPYTVKNIEEVLGEFRTSRAGLAEPGLAK
jgi:hypothetical protein